MGDMEQMRRFSRRRFLLGYTRPVTLAVTVVLVIIALSLSSAWLFALNQNFTAMTAWGEWIGTFVASLALLGTVYAVIAQVRQGETTSWNIALSRLGELYDLCLVYSDLAQMLAESSTTEEDPQPLYSPESLKPEQRVWLGSLFLAYEQIFVATLTLSHESRRVWRIYLANQLNKPSLRAQFCCDAVTARDYHQSFWRFVRGSVGPDGIHRGGAIHTKFFDKYAAVSREPQQLIELRSGMLSAQPLREEEYGFWAGLYAEESIRRQMYSAPLDSLESFKAFLRKRTLFTLLLDGAPIGGFSITREGQFMATFGFMLAPEFRGRGFSRNILEMLMEQAAAMGFRTLRADVYADNVPSIRALQSAGFRTFIWMEKNLPSDIRNADMQVFTTVLRKTSQS